MDFDPLHEDLIFSLETEPDQQCRNISITDDPILEDVETFTVSLTTTDEKVNINIASATVSVFDNDGEYSIHIPIPMCFHSCTSL